MKKFKMLKLIKHIQQACFPFLSFKVNREEFSARLPQFMQKLRPFYLDGVLRAGGRLENANVDFDVKHHIILPLTSHFTELVIRQFHAAIGHSGTSHTWSEIRQRFWTIKGSAVVRNSSGKCILCNSTVGKQLMADLPPARLQIHKPSFLMLGLITLKHF